MINRIIDYVDRQFDSRHDLCHLSIVQKIVKSIIQILGNLSSLILVITLIPLILMALDFVFSTEIDKKVEDQPEPDLVSEADLITENLPVPAKADFHAASEAALAASAVAVKPSFKAIPVTMVSSKKNLSKKSFKTLVSKPHSCSKRSDESS